MNEYEFHLFVIWEKGRPAMQRILEDVARNFTILRVVEYQWSRKRFFDNLCRFYGEPKYILRYKQLHCGSGAPVMIVVKDESPDYQHRDTTKGAQRVNTRIFDAKARYRQWSGGGHRVHGTNSPVEFAHDYTLLSGQAVDGLHTAAPWDGNIQTLRQDIVAGDGWESMSQLLGVLNNVIPYVILRNFQNLPENHCVNTHGDIDILCSRPGYLKRIARAKRASLFPGRVYHTVKIAGQDMPFDFRAVGDGYYDSKWQERIMENRVLNGGGFYIPDDENFFFSLVYHALIHKHEISKDYRHMLCRMAGERTGREIPPHQAETALAEILDEFMRKNSYSYTQPHDLTVHFNPRYTKRLPKGFARRKLIPLYRKIFKGK